MPFQKKYKNSTSTIHIRIPVEYKDAISELIEVLDNKYPAEQAVHFIRKYTNNFQ